MKRIANFLFEAGMLKRTPRTGFQFLGSGAESVAEHIFRTVYIGYTLGRLSGDVETDKIIKMCLFHDLPEARTGDLNYVNKKYVTADEKKAVKDLTATLPFGEEISDAIHEFLEGRTREARLARDADQLEMILALKEYKDVGNQYADEWLDFALKRLKTDIAQELSRVIVETDSSLWWFSDKSDWWINGEKDTKNRLTRLRRVKAKVKAKRNAKRTAPGAKRKK
ncbi:MAG: HD domain-containing protein [Nitrospiraceae bacterium]|nr:MAG: HD domain-containing protein [Nitrospiraceae bacterium]